MPVRVRITTVERTLHEDLVDFNRVVQDIKKIV